MRAMASDGPKLLIAVDPDPALWPVHISLVRALGELGIETTLVPTRGAFNAQQRLDIAATADLASIEPGLEFDPRNPDPSELARASLKLVQLTMDLKVDLLQIDQPALAAQGIFPCPVVAIHSGCPITRWDSLHSGELPKAHRWRAELIKAGLESADAIICPTTAHARRVQARFGLTEAPLVVHAGRDPLPVRGAAQHDYVLTAGRLWDEGTNLSILDAAAGRLGVPVRAAGPLQSPGGEAVMFDNLHCLGNLGEAEIVRWLAARPVFVSTALYDPLGLSILTAASAGCALILADIPDFREMWDEIAIFVDPQDERGFSETIANLVGDDFERAVIGRAARERAALRSPQAMAAQMAAIYRSLLPAIKRPVLAARAAA